jgi:hypothetical protein
MLMEKKWTEQQQKNSSIIITMRKLLKLTKISQDLDTQVKEKCLLICHSIWDQFLVSKSLHKQQETMIQRLWLLRSLIQHIALKLNQDASKMHLIYLMMQVAPKLRL